MTIGRRQDYDVETDTWQVTFTVDNAPDARLIAAAPELLDALHNVTDAVEAYQRADDDSVPERLLNLSYEEIASFVHAARAAIAKAEGKP